MEHNSSDDESLREPKRKLAGAAVLQTSVTAALYRRWKTKRDFAHDAVREMALKITPIPDTGSLKGDIGAITHRFTVALRHPLVRRILPDLHAEHARSDELSDLLSRVFLQIILTSLRAI